MSKAQITVLLAGVALLGVSFGLVLLRNRNQFAEAARENPFGLSATLALAAIGVMCAIIVSAGILRGTLGF